MKAIGHSGGKPITVPRGNRSGVGAKRRWLFDVAKTDRNRPKRSEGRMVVARLGVVGQGAAVPCPASAHRSPEPRRRFGLKRIDVLPSGRNSHRNTEIESAAKSARAIFESQISATGVMSQTDTNTVNRSLSSRVLAVLGIIISYDQSGPTRGTSVSIACLSGVQPGSSFQSGRRPPAKSRI